MDFEKDSQMSFITANFNDYTSLNYPKYKLRNLGILNIYFG